MPFNFINDSYQKLNYQNMIPFLGTMSIFDDIKLKNLVQIIKNIIYILTASDEY